MRWCIPRSQKPSIIAEYTITVFGYMSKHDGSVISGLTTSSSLVAPAIGPLRTFLLADMLHLRIRLSSVKSDQGLPRTLQLCMHYCRQATFHQENVKPLVLFEMNSQPRFRAKRACRRCNSRRVRCNVVDVHPCNNCARANATCEVFESRRGKHVREPVRRGSGNAQEGGIGYCNQKKASGDGSVPIANRMDGDNDVRPHAYAASIGQSSHSTDIHQFATTTKTPRPQPEPQGETEELYLGESATIRCVYDDQRDTGKHSSPEENARLKFHLPNVLLSEAVLPDFEAQRRERGISFLRSEGVFTMPAKLVSDILLSCYFEWFHPCFPILDRTETVEQYQAGDLSVLLAMAIFSVGAAYCDEEFLASTGLFSRERARYLFYSRAKDLYEVDYENNQLVVVQSLFLISFWRSGRLLYKHTRHWLGIALTTAQSRAMHRHFPNMDLLQSRMRRRLWWSIYIRECQCSAALGLPNRIRNIDCDIEPLQPADMDESASAACQLGEKTLLAFNPAEALYCVEMAKLALILGEVIDAEYTPRGNMDLERRNMLMEKLLQWERALPTPISSGSKWGENLNLHTAMLYFAYNNLVILLFRNAYIHNGNEGTDKEASIIAVQAATRISFLVEDLLSRDLMRYADIQLINSVFNALCIHVVDLRRRQETVARSVTEHRARVCLLALQELQKTWQVTVWPLQLRLFQQALDSFTAKRLQLSDGETFAATDEAADGPSESWCPASSSTLPEMWDLGQFSAEPGGLLDSSISDLVSGGDMTGYMEWPLAMEGLNDFASEALGANPCPTSRGGIR